MVEVYWRPGCPFCRMLLRPLRRSGLVLREVNIWEDPEAAVRVRSIAGGNETVPTVFIGDQALVNPSMRQVLQAAGAQPFQVCGTSWRGDGHPALAACRRGAALRFADGAG